ncbi:hypothetical protein GCM10010495_10350 [Kitasatospora herbaricolor]|uniref:GNAT family N-acetyltransferase n=1 Tax=Kitasatospora herbaricolor TaxID=68217 RepID=UPI00174A0C3A|nr:GNAT family N-acetyltransferase [Kitasatospora herbaricolor]MDQ0309530.1 hypothetical protein [Kitasatospora herbaricolor]GGV01239.1 hypothetical protein GCM10010495_10350 [Kitasatospora herbaricolor]
MSADLEFLEADRISGLPAAEWDALVRPEDLMLTTRWIGLTEASADRPLRYLLLRRAGRPVAALATVLGDATAPWVLMRTDTVLRWAAERGAEGAGELLADLGGPPDEALLPTLVCGGRHVGRTGMALAEHAERQDVAALVARAEELAGESGARSLGFLYVDEREGLLREVLAAGGYRSCESGRFSRLDVPAGGFEEYLGGFSRHRRSRMRAERRRLATAEVKVSLDPASAHDPARLAALELELLAKYGFTSWTPEHAERGVRRLFAAFGEDALVASAVADGKVRGFGVLVRRGDQWHAVKAGFDYGFQGSLPLYYETLYYHPVERAAEFGVRAIQYGIGSEEAKRSRGCVTTGNDCWVGRLRRP